jgi:hypothetical protein
MEIGASFQRKPLTKKHMSLRWNKTYFVSSLMLDRRCESNDKILRASWPLCHSNVESILHRWVIEVGAGVVIDAWIKPG